MSSSEQVPSGQTYADAMAASLRRRIAAGEFAGADGKLPSETDLVREYGRSKIVVRAVMTQLAAEGLVVSHERRGHFVRTIDPVTVSASGDWNGDSLPGRRPPRTEVRVRVVGGPDDPVPADVAVRLRVSPAAQVVLRDRTCYLGDQPYLLWPSWYHVDVAVGTLLMRAGEQATPGGLLAAVGITATPADDYLRARMATAEEAVRLRLPRVTPVLAWTRTLVDDSGTPVAVQEAVMPGDRAALTATIS